MENSNAVIPEGYMEDARGHLVPKSTIPEVEIAKDDLVKEIVSKARELREAISRFKGATFGDIAAFVELSAEKYQAPLRGAAGKGNITLMSFCGRFKVQRAISEHITFDEKLQAAKALIDECIKDWSQGSRDEIQVLVNSAFQVDKEGNINTGRVLGLRQYNITDERWLRAMQAISDSVTVTGSKSYIRVYERDGETGEYIAIPLDVAKA